MNSVTKNLKLKSNKDIKLHIKKILLILVILLYKKINMIQKLAWKINFNLINNKYYLIIIHQIKIKINYLIIEYQIEYLNRYNNMLQLIIKIMDFIVNKNKGKKIQWIAKILLICIKLMIWKEEKFINGINKNHLYIVIEWNDYYWSFFFFFILFHLHIFYYK